MKNKHKSIERTKIKRDIIFIIITAFLIVVSTSTEIRMISFTNTSLTSKIIIYAYINITVILFLFMFFLVIRNTIKLLIERRKDVVGAKLRTKLVSLFVIVSLVPTLFMFMVIMSTGFAGNVINKWYAPKIEKSMYYVMDITRFYHKHNMKSEPAKITRKMHWLSNFYKEYSQIRFIKNPIETTYLIFFSIFTLVILFLSLWVGFYLSKKLTKPIIDLVEGTKKVASGDITADIPVIRTGSNDEIGMLIDSFNAMAKDLSKNKQEIERANDDLRRVNEEIDRRRKYMEIILKNIHAGVIGIDMSGKIKSINNAAERTFHIDYRSAINCHYKEVFDKAAFSGIRAMIKSLSKENKESMTREIKLNVKDEAKVYIVNLTVLKDELNNYIGFIIVLNDTTDVMKAQRIAAWEEVAKRIAHEIKNPLTPIRLSAERLKRKFGGRFDKEESIFNEMADTIIKEVGDLKNLVDEFSLYARLPKANFEYADVNALANDIVSLYKNAHKNIKFITRSDTDLPKVFIDKLQIKRAFMNIMDNGVFSVLSKCIGKSDSECGGRIIVSIRKRADGGIVQIVFADNGSGISDEVMQNMYEPYFSTKHGGTGLGLAITNNIMVENNARIIAANNKYGGASFTVELRTDKV